MLVNTFPGFTNGDLLWRVLQDQTYPTGVIWLSDTQRPFLLSGTTWRGITLDAKWRVFLSNSVQRVTQALISEKPLYDLFIGTKLTSIKSIMFRKKCWIWFLWLLSLNIFRKVPLWSIYWYQTHICQIYYVKKEM